MHTVHALKGGKSGWPVLSGKLPSLPHISCTTHFTLHCNMFITKNCALYIRIYFTLYRKLTEYCKFTTRYVLTINLNTFNQFSTVVQYRRLCKVQFIPYCKAQSTLQCKLHCRVKCQYINRGGYRFVKLKICFVLEHFLMLWHILRIFVKKNWSVVNKLPLQPGKSKFYIFLVFCSFAKKL